MLSALIGNLCASINKDIHFSLIGDLVDPYKQHRVASEQLVFEPILSLGLFRVMRCIVQLDRKVHLVVLVEDKEIDMELCDGAKP